MSDSARITDSDVVRFLRLQKRLHFVCPRKVVSYWWECDCIGVTDSGFWHEVEVKHSAADFKRDFEKGSTWKKHDVLASKIFPAGCTLKPPNYFWFAMPEGLMASVQVPDYAGVLLKEDGKRGLWKHREAPRLHREKASPRFIEDVGRALEYRLYDALDRIDGLMLERSAK